MPASSALSGAAHCDAYPWRGAWNACERRCDNAITHANVNKPRIDIMGVDQSTVLLLVYNQKIQHICCNTRKQTHHNAKNKTAHLPELVGLLLRLGSDGSVHHDIGMPRMRSYTRRAPLSRSILGTRPSYTATKLRAHNTNCAHLYAAHRRRPPAARPRRQTQQPRPTPR